MSPICILAFLQLHIISVFGNGTYNLPKVLWDSDGNCDASNLKNISIPGDINYTICLNSIIMSKSILNFGDLSHRTKTKLKLRQCLKFSTFGGSITCGLYCCEDENKFPIEVERPNMEVSWSNQFIVRFNEIFPCVDDSNLPSKHTVAVRCNGGQHTSLWIEEIMKSEPNFHTLIKSADIAIFETTVNDITEGLDGISDGKVNFVKQQTELLLRMIKSINPNVSPLWLGASTRNGNWQNEYAREGDASHIHIDVLKRYNYPQLSVIDGLGPFYSPEALSWFRKTFRFDTCCHPSITGHKIIGYLLSQFLMLHYHDSQNPIFSQNEVLTDPSLLPLFFITKEHAESHIKTKSLYIDLTNSDDRNKYALANSSGWSVRTDKIGKPPGYIAHEVGWMYPLNCWNSSYRIRYSLVSNT